MTPTLALAYLFWTRHRRGLTLVGGYCLAVLILCAAVPAGAFTLSSVESNLLAKTAFFVLCFGSGAAVGYLLLVFTFARETQLEACESCYPPRLWTRPLPTYALVGWPMLWGSAVLMLVWLTFAWAERRLCSLDLPLVWPGLMAAALLAWCQAILWTSFPLPWLRLYLMIPGSILPFFIATMVLIFDESPVALCSLPAVLLLTAYGTALRGVARARHGDHGQWRWPVWLRWPWPARTRPPFLSAAEAQLWFEWRLHGLAFPVVVTFFAMLLLPMTPFYADVLDNPDGLEQPVVSPLLLQELGSLWLAVACLLPLPLLTAAMFGPEMGKLERKSCHLASFLATRPVSEAMLIRTKLVATAWSTLAGWSGLAIGLLLWLVLSGHGAEAARQFEAMRQRHASGLFWGWLILLVGGAIVASWLQMVQGMWIGLTGSRRVIGGASFCAFAALYGLIAFGSSLARHFEYWPVLGRVLPWLAGAALILKSLAAAWSLHALRRRQLIPSGVLWGMLLIWLALAAGLFAALYTLLPDNWFSVSGVVLGIVLLLPLTRVALAPLTLAWNRHR